jgi:hypothetical protein
MNEQRIEELAKQARAWAETAFKHQHEKFTSHWDNPVGYTVTHFFEQKFAELIVKECLSMCDETQAVYYKHRLASLNFTDKNRYAAGETAADTIYTKIKLHFGVEE